MVLGARLAVDELNGSVDNPAERLELVVFDTRDMSERAISSAARGLVEAGVDAAVSGYASRDNVEIEVLAATGIPYIVAEHSIETQRRIGRDPEGFETVWGLMPSYDAYGTAVPPYI